MSIETLTLSVLGMTCDGCVQSAQNAISEVAGVQSVVVDLAKEQATISYDDAQTTPEQLAKVVEDAGFSTTP
ncbi:MAG: heavy metal-associated domain-containing protein [Moraxella sp.]|nr:heavy metal-associated domain-containing protein [Moraxella sp.]